MTPEVQEAVTELRSLFGDLDAQEGPEGGARVIVKAADCGPAYSPSSSWIGFMIGFQYPRADVYPHFVDPELKRVDGNPLGPGFSGPIDWEGRKAIQISRRSNRLDPLVDTAATKLAKVIGWIRNR